MTIRKGPLTRTDLATARAISADAIDTIHDELDMAGVRRRADRDAVVAGLASGYAKNIAHLLDEPALVRAKIGLPDLLDLLNDLVADGLVETVDSRFMYRLCARPAVAR